MKKDCDAIMEEFVALMENEDCMDGNVISFAGVCRRLGVEPDWLDDRLYATFGVSGRDMVKMFRYRIPLSMV